MKNDPYDPVMDYLMAFVQAHKLQPIINQIKHMPKQKRTFTNSQKIRLRLKVYFDSNDTGFDDFEEFYTSFTDSLLENIEFIASMFLK
jgi:hypothetical protein